MDENKNREYSRENIFEIKWNKKAISKLGWTLQKIQTFHFIRYSVRKFWINQNF